MEKVKRIRGKRYWLDACKDISGVYKGRTRTNGFCFGNIERQETCILGYIENNGCIQFAQWYGFTFVDAV